MFSGISLCKRAYQYCERKPLLGLVLGMLDKGEVQISYALL